MKTTKIEIVVHKPENKKEFDKIFVNAIIQATKDYSMSTTTK